MKLKFTIFALLLVFISSSYSNDLFSQKKYYVVFDNFEDDIRISTGSCSSIPLVEHLYFNTLSYDNIIGEYAVMETFSSETFETKEITEYDVAIFPLGNVPLHATYDGIKIIDKVQEMLDAGKGVIIIGRSYMDQAKEDESVSTFLEQDLMITHNRYPTSTSEGDSIIYERFDLVDIGLDPVGQGKTKVCNASSKDVVADYLSPYIYYESADFFTINESSPTIGFDRVQPSDEELYAGARWSDAKGSKLVFWSVGFDAISKSESEKFQMSLINAINWITEDMLKPESWIESEVNRINFEKVDLGEYKEEELEIRNNGKESLTISEIQMENFFTDEGVFTIEQGEVTPNSPLLLEPNEYTKVKIRFEPPAENVFKDALIIKSDAFNSNSLTIALEGECGEIEEKEPLISEYEHPVHLGNIEAGTSVDDDIPLFNTGNDKLEIYSIEFTNNDDEAFSFSEPIHTPIELEPGETYNISVGFLPLTEEKEYYGEIKIASNAMNAKTTYIELTGRTVLISNIPKATIETKEIAWGEVEKYEDYSFEIESTGDADLIISDIFVDGTDEAKKVFKVISDNNASIPPGETFEVTVRFEPKPEQNKKYSAELQIITNALGNNIFYIPLFGSGILSVNDNGAAELTNLFSIKVTPAPVTGISMIQYEIKGTDRKNLKLYLLDETGKTIDTYINKSVTPGIYNTEINADNYFSGSYYIIAEIEGRKAIIPVIIW